MKQKNSKFLNFIFDIITSGKYTIINNDFSLSDSQFRHILLNFFSIAGFISTVFLSFLTSLTNILLMLELALF